MLLLVVPELLLLLLLLQSAVPFRQSGKSLRSDIDLGAGNDCAALWRTMARDACPRAREEAASKDGSVHPIGPKQSRASIVWIPI